MVEPYEDLRLAIEAGDLEATARLLNAGLEISAENFRNATIKKDYDILKLLLSKGFNINTDINDSVPSALVYAIKDRVLASWFLDHGADPNKRCRLRHCTPLSYAVREGSFDVIRLLFEGGGEIQQGQLLHYAAMRTESDSDSTQVLSFIYDQDPDFNKSRLDKLLDEDTPEFFMNQRSGVCTPLHYAAMSGSVDMVCFLKDKGAVSRKDPYNRTPLSYAIRNGHHDKIVPILGSMVGSRLPGSI
ncbi:ankyrin repeat-containing domain protein [Aspergillus pseudoustus]|uniref:Ankyrin repeat-containing domain protein n=1 Tax=Aspergillus pseudoustus TaxID=1810923 RepID=A0ABR4K4R0_9EURO